ncbi:MAG: DUF3418 domain-containing protein, partial [Betaproteobacteria bacterium]
STALEAGATGAWVMAGELAETTRLYGRTIARIEPEWIEQAADDRVERTYFEPHWDQDRGEVVASERVTLYGLTLVPRRRVSFGAVDPVSARQVFLREGLAPGEHGIRAPFAEHNRKLLAEVAELEHKARRQDVLVDAEDVVAFFDALVPAQVCTRAAFERWRTEAEVLNPRLLYLTREDLMRHHAAQVTEEQFPATMDVAGNSLPLRYRFEPGHPEDGITLTLPLALLNQVDESRLSWLVPGMVREKVQWLLKALPKALRNRETPLSAVVTAFLVDCDGATQPLPVALREFLAARWQSPIPADVWDGAAVPAHLQVNVRVVDAAGADLGAGRDLRGLQSQFGKAAQLTFAAGDPGIERRGMRAWECGDLPVAITFVRDGRRLTGYPALIDEGESVAVRLLDTGSAAKSAHRAGVLRLLRIALKEQLRQLDKGWPGFNAVALQLRTRITPDQLLGDWLDAVCDRAFLGDDPVPRDAAGFEQQRGRARTRLAAVRDSAQRVLAEIAIEHGQLSQALPKAPVPLQRLVRALEAHRDRLVFPGFLQALGWDHLTQLPRYLRGIARRVQKYAENPERDARHAVTLETWHQQWTEQMDRRALAGTMIPELADFRWWIEEYAIALFAQELKTQFPVSQKRLERRWSELTR